MSQNSNPAAPVDLFGNPVRNLPGKKIPGCAGSGSGRSGRSRLLSDNYFSAFSAPDPAPVYIGQTVHVRPSYVVSRATYDMQGRGRSAAQLANERHLSNNKHNGVISDKALKAIRNAVNWLLLSAREKKVYSKQRDRLFKFRVNFVTLTLPDSDTPVTSRFLQERLLNPLLVYLRKYHKLGAYVWKLEFQQNGKLHVHITTDTFIHWRALRSAWNRQLEREGVLSRFIREHGHNDPNSTDVHSVKKIRNLAAYICKYMSKQAPDLAKLSGRIWGCSQNLSRAGKCQVFIDRDACHHELKPLFRPDVQWKPIEFKDKFTGLQRRAGEIFFFNAADWIHKVTGVIKDTFSETIANVRGDVLYAEQLHVV